MKTYPCLLSLILHAARCMVVGLAQLIDDGLVIVGFDCPPLSLSPILNGCHILLMGGMCDQWVMGDVSGQSMGDTCPPWVVSVIGRCCGRVECDMSWLHVNYQQGKDARRRKRWKRTMKCHDSESFHYAPAGPPTSWIPPCFFPIADPSVENKDRPTSHPSGEQAAGGRFISVCHCWVEFSVVGLYLPLLGSIRCGGAPPHCHLVGFAFTALMLKSFTWPWCGLPDCVLFDTLVLSFETLVLGIQVVSGIMIFFSDVPHRPPTSWVPPCIASSLTPPSSDDEPPTSL